MRASYRMIPRLRAGEKLDAIHAVNLGMAGGDPATKAMRELERVASGAPKPPATRATPEQLAAAGIAVEVVTRDG